MMTQYLLDTCVVSELKKPQPESRVVRWVEAQPEHTLVLSVVTVAELLSGVLRMPEGHRKLELTSWVNAILADYQDRTLLIAIETAREWAAIQHKMAQAGHGIHAQDCWLAAQARQHRMTLVTRNVRHFQHADVAIVNPWV